MLFVWLIFLYFNQLQIRNWLSYFDIYMFFIYACIAICIGVSIWILCSNCPELVPRNFIEFRTAYLEKSIIKPTAYVFMYIINWKTNRKQYFNQYCLLCENKINRNNFLLSSGSCIQTLLTCCIISEWFNAEFSNTFLFGSKWKTKFSFIICNSNKNETEKNKKMFGIKRSGNVRIWQKKDKITRALKIRES